MTSRSVLSGIAALVAMLLALVTAPGGAADTHVDVSLSMPDWASTGSTFTAWIKLFTIDPAPASTLHLEYDPAVLTLGPIENQRDCGLKGTGSIDCAVDVLNANGSAEFRFKFTVLSTDATTVRVSDDGVVSSVDLNGPPKSWHWETPPILSGDATVGGALTTTTGSISPPYDYVYGYHWLRCTPDRHQCGMPDINGATYVLTEQDAGCVIEVVVTAAVGSTVSDDISDPTPIVQPARTCDPWPPRTSPPPAEPSPTAPATTVAAPPLELAAAPLPAATVGSPFDEPLVTGGTPPYTIEVTRGWPPDGLEVAPNGHLHGTPTKPGFDSFNLNVHDAGGAGVGGIVTVEVSRAPGTEQPTVRLAGRVLARGRPLNGALVVVGHGGGAKGVITGADGRFVLSGLARGSWPLRVTKQGFVTVARRVPAPATVTIVLRPRKGVAPSR